MAVLIAVVAVLFIFVSGRNDGAPIIAVPSQTAREHVLLPLALLWVAIPLVPALGISQVAEALETLAGFSSSDGLRAFSVLTAVLLTLLLSSLVKVPTSITLALVGALTGAALAVGAAVDGKLLARVLILGLAAPMVAAGLAWLISKTPIRNVGSLSAAQVVKYLQGLTFPILVLAYAANDGQKIAFAAALVLGSTVSDIASSPPILLAASTVFLLGVLTGLKQSGKFVRHGVTAMRPLPLLWAEVSTAITVIGGSALGVPLSMTQSLTGSLMGVGLERSRRHVYWASIRRIALAWVWTLPAATGISFLLVWGLGAIFQNV